MNCYLCSQSAEYSCSCSVPVIFICHEHLKTHKEVKNNRHIFNVFEDEINITLFKE